MKERLIRCVLFMIAFITLVLIACSIDAINNKNFEQTTKYEKQQHTKEFETTIPYQDFERNDYLNKSISNVTIRYKCNEEEIKDLTIEKVIYGESFTIVAPEIDLYEFQNIQIDKNIYQEKEIKAFYTFDIEVTINYKHYSECEQTTLWVNTNYLNIRELPTTESKKVGGLSQGYTINVYNYNAEKEWSLVDYNGTKCYAATRYLSTTEITKKQNNNSSVYSGSIRVIKVDAGFHAYALLIGGKFRTPEEIDAIYGYAAGTTRSWQKYLYSKLSAAGQGWFYPYALAQARAESGWNLYTINASNGLDTGLFQFRSTHWAKKCAHVGISTSSSIFDPYAQIDIYVHQMCSGQPCHNWICYDLAICLSCHKWNQAKLDQKYVNAVMNRFNNEIKICD